MPKSLVVLACSLAACATAAAPEPASVASAGAPVAGSASGTTSAPLGIPNERAPLPSVLTGGMPSAEQLERAQAAGYKTVISLLPDEEAGDEATQARAAGLRYRSIPISGPADLTETNARRLHEAMNEPGAKPLLIHCASGNRAGALLALKAYYVDQQSKQQAIELGEHAGLTSLKSTVEAQLQQADGRR